MEVAGIELGSSSHLLSQCEHVDATDVWQSTAISIGPIVDTVIPTFDSEERRWQIE